MDTLVRAGAVARDFKLPEAEAAYDVFLVGGLSAIELRSFLDRELPEWLDQLDPVIAPAVRSAESLSALDYLARVARLAHLARAATARLDTVDVIASPTLCLTPPLMSEVADADSHLRVNRRIVRNTAWVNYLGLCAITMSVARDRAGMPVGLQLTAPAARRGEAAHDRAGGRASVRRRGRPARDAAAACCLITKDRTMAVIDVQVHAYERNHPGRPWAGHLHGPASATGEEMLEAMDAVGVDAAIIVSTFNLYRYDPSYALEVYAKYPERFRVVKPIDPANPAVDDVLADWAKTKGAVGVRLMLREEQISDPTDPRLNRALAAAGRHGLPVNFLCWGRLDDGTEAVRRNPDTVIVIDHLGLLQPNEPPPLVAPWADLPKLLALAAYPNVRVKISGACTLSREAFPL